MCACVCVKLSHQFSRSSGRFRRGCHTSQHPLCFTEPKGNTQSQAGRLKSALFHYTNTHKHTIHALISQEQLCMFPYSPATVRLYIQILRHDNIYSCVLRNLRFFLKCIYILRDRKAICKSLHFNYKAMLMRLGNLFRCGSSEKTRRQ